MNPSCENTSILPFGVKGRVQTTWTNEGEGIAQMATTLNNSFFSKSVHIGGGGRSKMPKILYMPPYINLRYDLIFRDSIARVLELQTLF